MGAPARQRLTTKKRAAFLAALAAGHSVTAAATAAGVSRATVYEHRAAGAAFAAAWADALAAGAEYLEDEARRRAVEGTDKPVFYQGVRCGTIREHSDTLLIFLLKGRKPETYRENATLRHEGQVDVQHSLDLARLSDDDLATLERLVGAAQPGGDPGGAGQA